MYKGLGTDGWPMEFYLGFYDMIEEDLLGVVGESIISGQVLRAMNTTILF
jgi:hypothetical protein